MTPVTLPAILTAMTVGQYPNTVNARDLHSFLEVKTRFNDWIRLRIKEYGFQEHRDYECFSNFSNAGNQQLTPSKEYALTLKMAKQLAMVERNAKGKEVRQYFIESEKRLMAILANPAPTQNPFSTMSKRDLLYAAIEQAERAQAIGNNAQQ